MNYHLNQIDSYVWHIAWLAAFISVQLTIIIIQLGYVARDISKSEGHLRKSEGHLRYLATQVHKRNAGSSQI